MKTLFGNPKLFAIGVTPLEGPPPEPDASAAVTWTALEIWAGGQSLSAHTHVDSQTVHEALHWPAIYFARWLVRSWPALFEKQAWPLPEFDRNARDLCEELDELAAEHFESDEKLDVRDDFVAHHSLLAAGAGGLLPDLYFAHDGDRVSIAWGNPAGSSFVRFHHVRGEIDRRANTTVLGRSEGGGRLGCRSAVPIRRRPSGIRPRRVTSLARLRRLCSCRPG